MDLVMASPKDLGYEKIGPRNPDDEERTRVISEYLIGRRGYEVFPGGAERWLRHPARKLGQVAPQVLRMIGDLEGTGDRDAFSRDVSRQYQASEYARLQQPRGHPDWQGLGRMAEEIREQKGEVMGGERLSRALAFCLPEHLERLLKEHVLPAFFDVYPGGRVLAYLANRDYEEQFGTIRAGYSLSLYDLQDLRGPVLAGGFGALKNWHTVNTLSQPSLLFDLASLVWYPYMSHMSAGPAGLELVFVFDDPPRNRVDYYPVSWMSRMQSQCEYGAQAHGDRGNRNPLVPGPPGIEHQRLINDSHLDVAEHCEFLQWVVERYNALSFHASDPTEHLDDAQCVDFVFCHEHMLTLDRIMRKGVLSVCAEEASLRREAAFEVADLLEAVYCHWAHAQPGPRFRELLGPTSGELLLSSSFTTAPESARNMLGTAVQGLFEELRRTIEASVWVTPKKTAAGVMVKNRNLTRENEQAWEEFVPSVLRALRNAHHGYMTAADRQARPSRYLALVDGTLPASIGHLGCMWALATIVAPNTMLDWNWKEVGAWD